MKYLSEFFDLSTAPLWIHKMLHLSESKQDDVECHISTLYSVFTEHV